MRLAAALLTAVLAVEVVAPVAARTWRSKTGNFTVEATLVDTGDGVALLKKPDGTVISVGLEKLSADDIDYIDEAFDAAIRRVKSKASARLAPANVGASAASSTADPQASFPPLVDGKPFEEGPVLPEVPPSGLRCRWRHDLDYPYLFEAVVEVGEYVETVQGMIVIQPARETAPAGLPKRMPKELVKRGSAFVVRSDGYLITSARLVENARSVKIRLGSESHAARVLALNTRYDLALLRIPATGLRAMPLAGRQSAELTDDVYAVGYGKPDAAGSKPELSRGTLAGVIDRSGDQMLQMDAGFAAGLLGGPLVNRKGEVIGVAHSDITDGPISDVGLAVPAHYARRILQDKGLQFHARGRDGPLAEAALAELVRPSVAAVTVMRRFQDARTSSPKTLSSLACWISSLRSKRGFGALPEAMENFTFRDSAWGGPLVDDFGSVDFGNVEFANVEFGNMSVTTGGTVLPYFLGKPGQLPLEPLSPTGEFTWKVESPVRIKLVQRPYALKYFRPADVPLLPNFLRVYKYNDPRQHQRQLTDNVHLGTHVATYEILDSDDDVVVVKKRFEMQTLGLPGEPKFARLLGEGTVHFDRASGLVRKIDTTATITHHLESTDIKASLTLTCRAADPVKRRELSEVNGSINEQLQLWRSELLASVGKASRTTPEASPNLVLDPILADLRTSPQDKRSSILVLTALTRVTPVDDRRDAVLEVLEPWSGSSDAENAKLAAKLMGAWASEKDIPRLLKLFGNRDSGNRDSGNRDSDNRDGRSTKLRALGQSKLPAMATALAACMENPTDRHQASLALTDMGPIAEPAVIEMLKHKDPLVQSVACDVLAEIGGEASIAALGEFLASDPETGAATAAGLAVDALAKKKK